ncbi:MAG: hypothetical protein ABWX74_20650 [Aeromicrobium sp.]
MLTTPRMARAFLALLGTTMVATLLVLVVAPPAEAGVCGVDPKTGELIFGDCDNGVPGTDGDGDGGGGGTAQPSCELRPGDNVCIKGKSCLLNDPAKNSEEDVADELPPKPEGDDWHVAYRSCEGETGIGTWYWSRDTEPTPEELATTAFNQLKTPAYTVTFNPPTRTLVNLDTWWWAEGPDVEPITASAGSVTATAGPDRLEVDPGDGSGVMSCPFVTKRSDACSYTYLRSSKGDGYPARMRLVYSVSFTDGGAALDVAGLPTELSSDWGAVTVPVREAQTLVRPNRG